MSHLDGLGRWARKSDWRHSPQARRAFGRSLFDQQLWCWGQDVCHSSGNALLRFGMTRVRPPDPDDGSTRYAVELAGGLRVALWAFGAFVGDADSGGLFLARRDFVGRLMPSHEPPVAHLRDDVAKLARPAAGIARVRARRLQAALFRWIAAYERWVQAHLGGAWRARCVREWLRPVVPGEAMADRWALLATVLDDACAGRQTEGPSSRRATRRAR